MSLWWWVLIGLGAWLVPAVVVGLMLGWALLWRRDKRARHRKPLRGGHHDQYRRYRN
jgi:hypothetical protein